MTQGEIRFKFDSSSRPKKSFTIVSQKSKAFCLKMTNNSTETWGLNKINKKGNIEDCSVNSTKKQGNVVLAAISVNTDFNGSKHLANTKNHSNNQSEEPNK